MAKRRTRRGKQKASPARRPPARGRAAQSAAAARAARTEGPARAGQLEPAPPAEPVQGTSIEDVELHRHGFILHVPAVAGDAPATAMLLEGNVPVALCTCERAGKGRGPCPHVTRLQALRRELARRLGTIDVTAAFRASLWYRLLAPLAEEHEAPAHAVMVRDEVEDGAPVLRVYEPGGGVLVTYLAGGPEAERFRSRLVLHGRGEPGPTRALLIEWVMERTATAHEQEMRARGHRTHGQVIEESFWHRLAYHAFREHGPGELGAVRFAPEIDRESDAVRVSVSAGKGTGGRAPLFRVTVPQRAARALLRAMHALLPADQAVPVHPEPVRPLVRMVARQGGGLRIEPVVRVGASGGKAGEERILMIEERFRYGELAYLPALDRLVALEEPGPVAEALHLVRPVDVDAARTGAVLGKVATALSASPDAPDEILGLRVLTAFERVTIDTEALGRDWCWLSVRYGAGAADVELDEILRARRRGQRFLESEDGWIDTQSPAFTSMAERMARHQIEDLDQLVEALAAPHAPHARLRITRLALLHLLATGGGLAVSLRGAQAEALERLLAVTPIRPLAPLRGLRSTLRDYQVRGVEWLLYLYDNGFGGLLCDDMGLGKTHQIAAFLLALREQRQVRAPFLVVCPTTVLSHWQRIIDAHVPGLRAAVFHGGGRDLAAAMGQADLLLTSYGILRNDIDALARIELAAAVFDEAQLLKNPQTLAYQAATRLATGMRLGLSGTPIENSLEDLAALLDLTLPGYLGSMEAFRARFVQPIEERGDAEARRELGRLVAPFVLRRTKHAVLDQLPPKIEDVRTCALSEEQIKLYRDAVDTRGRELIAALRDEAQPVPYIHIFALLTLLKQICCHPALVAGDPEEYEAHESAKWELAKELLRESLASGHKIVVYSQFLGMLRIFERHLASQGIGFAKLTGQTRKRGEVIARFQEDPSCRVFLASLTAGGVGIDLVAASVVMHYDRWWNAAREDQATDRVHRIGQTRGVHVLKLVTEGTLEEKIAALIAKKRRLMESVVQESDQAAIEVLDRAELAALMSFDLAAASVARRDRARAPVARPHLRHRDAAGTNGPAAPTEAATAEYDAGRPAVCRSRLHRRSCHGRCRLSW